MKQFCSRAWGWWKTRTTAHKVIFGFLVLLIVACIVYLSEGPDPAKDGVVPREEAEKRVHPAHYAVDGVHFGVVFSLVLAVLLVPFAGFFGRSLRSGFGADKKIKRSGAELILLGLIIVLSIAILSKFAIPRFEHSLFHDEELSMRRLIVHDHLRVGEDGLADRFSDKIIVRPAKWSETLWWYDQPNNHMGFSVWARLIHSMWPAGDSPEEPYFNPSALRLAAFIPAALTLAILAVFLSSIGQRVASFALPLLLAMHPWFIKYASEARGYSLTMMLVSCCLLFVWKALSTGRWRWFIGYGLAQFLVLYTNPGTFFLLFVLNVSLYLWLFVSRSEEDDRSVLIGRFFLPTAVGAMVTVIMMRPVLMQVKISHMEIAYGIEMFKDMGASFLTGMRWFLPHDETLVTLGKVVEAHPMASVMILIGISVLALLGVYSLFRKNGPSRILAVTMVLPMPIFLLFIYLNNAVMYHWYTVNMLPLFWIAVTIGMGFLAKRIGGNSSKREAVTGAILILLSCTSLYWIGSGQRQMQVDIPLDPSLESVRFTRDVIDPFDPRTEEVITVGFHKDTRGNDPALYRVQKGPEVFKMMMKADEENKPLYVNLGQLEFARGHRQDIMEIIDDERYFEEVAVFKAMEPTATRWIFRYKPGSYTPGADPQS